MAAQKAYYSECQAHLEGVEGSHSFRSTTVYIATFIIHSTLFVSVEVRTHTHYNMF